MSSGLHSERAADVDAVVVLGCRVSEHGARGALLRRLERGLALLAEVDGRPVVCAGGRRWPGGLEAHSMREWLVAHGVPAAQVLVEDRSRSTRENAREAATLLRPLAARRIALVTSASHLPRATRHFRAVGLSVLGVPAREEAQGLAALRTQLREWCALGLDALRGAP